MLFGLIHLHRWEFLESFITEGRKVERHKCTECQRTRVSIPARKHR